MHSKLQKLLLDSKDKHKPHVILFGYNEVIDKLNNYRLLFVNLKTENGALTEEESKALSKIEFSDLIETLFESVEKLYQDTHAVLDILEAFSEQNLLSNEVRTQLSFGLLDLTQTLISCFREYQNEQDFRDYKLVWLENTSRLRFVSKCADC